MSTEGYIVYICYFIDIYSFTYCGALIFKHIGGEPIAHEVQFDSWF